MDQGGFMDFSESERRNFLWVSGLFLGRATLVRSFA